MTTKSSFSGSSLRNRSWMWLRSWEAESSVVSITMSARSLTGLSSSRSRLMALASDPPSRISGWGRRVIL